MKVENIEVVLRVLRPTKADNWLTNGEVYSQEVYLGKEDNPDNWKEITAKEYEAAMKEAGERIEQS